MRINSAFGYVQAFLLLLLFLAFSSIGFAQSETKISGTVSDGETNEALSFVDVYFENTTIGVSTADDGSFEISTTDPISILVASFVGYQTVKVPVISGKTQTVNIELFSDAIEIEGAIVTAKKQRYSKKNNPAVDLMREVIARKDGSGVNGKPFCSYDKYEKIQVDLNNIDTGFRKRKIFNELEFVWTYLDSTDKNSRPYLPMLLRETASKVYHQRNPSTVREYVSGLKSSKLDVATDQSNLNQVINALYQDVNIYANEITLIQKQFISPLAPLAISFYRFYIVDTVEIAGQNATILSFIPKNQATYGFTGNIWVSNDSTYQVLKVKMGLFGDVNLNFVNTIHIEQEFQNIDSSYLLLHDKVIMEFSLIKQGMGFTGTKNVFYDDYTFSPPPDLAVFGGVDRTIISKDAEFQTDAYWDAKRQVPLNKNEAGVYQLVDTMAQNPKFKRIQTISSILLRGYTSVGKIDIGPISSFVGFNPVEGLKPKFGGETNLKFSEKWFIQGYGAYGVDDRRFKYAGLVTYSFNENHLKNPRHYTTVSYVKDTGFPGYEQQAVPTNNVFTSFRWGILDKMLFSNTFKVAYVKETKSLEYGVYYLNTKRRPYGRLSFNYGDPDSLVSVKSINTSEVGLNIRFAPNQQYTQRGNVRNRIFNKYPIFSLSYAAGLEGVHGGEYNYHRIDASIFKRFELSILGSTNVEISAGKVFGNIPYILMHIPKANQTYAYKTEEYNLINFMEFVGEEYVSINFRHYFEGFFLNRIPLIKKSKLREVLTFKATFGSVSDENNPALNENLIQFPVDEQDRETTTTLSNKPYMEAGVGITNIAKFFRVDLVQRLTYLDRPDVQELFGTKGLGLRVQFAVGF